MKQRYKGLTLNDRFFSVPDLEEFCKSAIKIKTEPKWKLSIYSFILDFLDNSEVIIQKTSGTTGERKIIELPKTSMIASARNTVDFFGLKENDIAVLCLPIQYIAGKMMVVRALVAGLNLKLIQPSGTPDFSEVGNIDFCAMVPMQATNLLEQNNWPDIKTLILGGAETNRELCVNLQKVKTKVFETYGMAETCSHVALKQINGKPAQSVFTALPNIQLSTDERDCLVIKAAYLPEQITTNDRVKMIKENQFEWLGRIDNVINSGGIKIQPEILEKKIEEILQKPCVILSEPDEVLGQKTVLIVETEEPENSNQILEKLTPHFDKKMLPKTVKILKELPRNKSFKIDRIALKGII
jgi:O-succinylbenzoic acid--CoA ligase